MVMISDFEVDIVEVVVMTHLTNTTLKFDG